MGITKKYRVTCVITEGDPYLVEKGDKFVWSRDEFRSDTNPLENPPVNLQSLGVTSTGAQLEWIDETSLGKIFNIRFRKNGSNIPGDIYYVNGITNTDVNVQDKIGTKHLYTFDYFSVGIATGEWMWSVCSIFDTDQKNFTMWSDESLLIIK